MIQRIQEVFNSIEEVMENSDSAKVLSIHNIISDRRNGISAKQWIDSTMSRLESGECILFKMKKGDYVAAFKERFERMSEVEMLKFIEEKFDIDIRQLFSVPAYYFNK